MASATRSGTQNFAKRLVLCLAALLCLGQPANAQNSASDFARDFEGVAADIKELKADADAVPILPRYKAPPCKPNKIETRDRLDELQSQLNDLVDFGESHITSFFAAGGSRPSAEGMNRSLNRVRRDAQSSIDDKLDQLNKAPVDPCPRPGTSTGAGGGSTGTGGTTGSTGQQPTTSPPSGLTPPILSTVPDPGPAPKFCSEEEKEKYLETLRAELEEAIRNAGKADEFRDAVRQPVNGNPPNPEEVRQAEREAKARQSVFEKLQRRYDEARNAPIVDCDENSGVGVLPGGVGVLPGGAGGGGLAQQAAQAGQDLDDATTRCDLAAAEAAVARLRQLRNAAREDVRRARTGGDKAEIDRAIKQSDDLTLMLFEANERLRWILENCKEPSGTGFLPGSPPTIENHGDIQPPAGTPQQRAARLEAINQLRTSDANNSATKVISSQRRPERDPSADARADAAIRVKEAERERYHKMAPQSQEAGPLAQNAKTDALTDSHLPPEEKQPPQKPAAGPGNAPPAENGRPTELPDVEAEDAPTDYGGGKGSVGAGFPDLLLKFRHIPLPSEKSEGKERARMEQAPPVTTEESGDGALRIGPRPPRKPRRPRVDDPMEPLTPPSSPENPESFLDDLEDYEASGDLRPDTSVIDGLTIEFNKARDACDLKTFLAVRARYLAEIRRILSKPNLSSGAREHYERILKAAEETAVPFRVPLPCPVLIR